MKKNKNIFVGFKKNIGTYIVKGIILWFNYNTLKKTF